MTRRKTLGEFKQEVYAIAAEEYSVIDTEYINRFTPILLKHNTCGHVFDIRPTNFIGLGQRCPKCNGGVRRKTTDYFSSEVYNLVKEEYTVTGEYIGVHTPIEMRHNICDHIFKVRPGDFLHKNSRCPKCGREAGIIKRTLTHEEFCDAVKQVAKEYEVISTYVNMKTDVDIRHSRCGFEFNVKPYNFVHNGSRCPMCFESKGERKIKIFLDGNDVRYKIQYSFADCKNIRPLKFDFAIFNDDDSLRCLVEYDGEFHFKSIKGLKGEKGLIYQRENDRIKDNYCKEHGIKLIRIPYWESDNINNILKGSVLLHEQI